MALLTQYTAAQDAEFQQRVQMAAVHQAVLTVQQESPSTTNHTRRLAFARDVLLNPVVYGQLIANGVAANDVTNNDNDGVLLATVAAFWDSFAGSTPP
jgi:hypothetical protein